MRLSTKRRTTSDDVRRVALAALATALDDRKEEAKKKPGLTGMRAVATGAVIYTAGKAAFGSRRFIREHLGSNTREEDEEYEEPEAEEDEEYEEPRAEEDEEYEEPRAEEDEEYEEPEAEEDEEYEEPRAEEDEEPEAEEDEEDEEPRAEEDE